MHPVERPVDEEAAPPPPPDPAVIAFIARLHAATPRLYVARALLVVCVAVYALTGVLGAGIDPTSQALARWGGNIRLLTTAGEWWRLFTCMFLHGGPLHLLLNMWILWSGGPLLERLLGNGGFLVAYLLSGLFGSVASLFWNPPNVVSVGASGAIFGLYGALLGLLLRHRHTVPRPLWEPLLKNGALFLGLNLLFGLSHKGIDVAAHVGGLCAGALCGAFGLPLPGQAQESAGERVLRLVGLFMFGCAAAAGLLRLMI
jgi:rhomboid protease GluP